MDSKGDVEGEVNVEVDHEVDGEDVVDGDGEGGVVCSCSCETDRDEFPDSDVVGWCWDVALSLSGSVVVTAAASRGLLVTVAATVEVLEGCPFL